MPDQLTQQQTTSTGPAAPETNTQETSRTRSSLQGKGFAEQEAMLSPGASAKVQGGATPPVPAAPAPQAGPPALTAGAYVLSRDPQYAKSGFVKWFADQVAAKVGAWGLAADSSAVWLATDGQAPVVALNWSAAWGAKPATREFGLDMRPLDARAAVTGVQALKGWGTVAVDARGKLDSVLGGETNELSNASRAALRPKFAGLDQKPEAEQAATLEGILGAKEAVPYLADEQVETEPAQVNVTGPTEQAGYAFAGGAADAHVYQAVYTDGVTLEIVAPKAPDAALHHHSVQEAADAARYVPTKSRAVIKTILLNTQVNPDDAYWAVQYNTPNFHSYMTAGAAGVVTIYPNTTAQPGANVMRGSIIHETGHTWSYQQWGQDTTKGKWLDWKTAMDKDRVSVSGYAMNDIAEDVAETVRVYGSTKGKPKYDEYKAMIPARLTILEAELG